MDTALKLKIAYDKGEIKTFSEAETYIDQSELMAQLLQKEDFDTLALMNRLIELSEIPFVSKLPQVKLWLNELVERTSFGQGFSYSGNANEMLACYNAMITSVLIRLAYHDEKIIEQGVQWIINYQNMSRGLDNKWEGQSIFKYGGCLKKTPCYIGVVKSTIALSDYVQSKSYIQDIDVEQKLEQGFVCILSHHLYLRKSMDKPITSYITKLTFPFSYKINVIELLRLMKRNNKFEDERCLKAKEYLLSKQKKLKAWNVHSIPNPKHWVMFDKPKERGEWITYEIEKLFQQ